MLNSCKMPLLALDERIWQFDAKTHQIRHINSLQASSYAYFIRPKTVEPNPNLEFGWM